MLHQCRGENFKKLTSNPKAKKYRERSLGEAFATISASESMEKLGILSTNTAQTVELGI